MQVQFPWCIATVNHFYRYRYEQISHNRHRLVFVQWSAKHLKILYKMSIVMTKKARPHSGIGRIILKKKTFYKLIHFSRISENTLITSTYSMRIKNNICKIFRGKYCNGNGFHFSTNIIFIDAWLVIFKVVTICGVKEM